jgi:hypothetical protein
MLVGVCHAPAHANTQQGRRGRYIFEEDQRRRKNNMYLNIPFLIFSFFIDSTCLKLNVECKQVYTKTATSIIKLPIIMSNCSDRNILCYNVIGGDPLQGLSENLLCDSEGSAGFAVILFDKNSKMVRPEMSIPDSLHYQSLSVLNQYLEQARQKFREGRLAIRKGQCYKKELVIDLKDYKLERGKYKFQIVYRSGRGVLNEIDQIAVSEDEKNAAANTYFGCAKSNIIELIVL